MTATVHALDELYRVQDGHVNFVDVPELGYLMVEGVGTRAQTEFVNAARALDAVSREVRALLDPAPGLTPLEVLWRKGRWRALMMQPDPIDEEYIAQAIMNVWANTALPALDRLVYQRWAEGRCAQATSIAALHRAVAEAGYRPSGPRHEIYLSDRALIRQQIVPL